MRLARLTADLSGDASSAVFRENRRLSTPSWRYFAPTREVIPFRHVGDIQFGIYSHQGGCHMKKFAGVALAALALPGVAWAQPIVIEQDQAPRARSERPMERQVPTRGPEAERGPPGRSEMPVQERRDVQSGPSRGQDAERPQAPKREQAQKESPSSIERSRSGHDEKEAERNRAAQREQPSQRDTNRSGERAQPNSDADRSTGSARSSQPENRTSPSNARSAQPEPQINQPGTASTPEKPAAGPQTAQPDQRDTSRIAETVRQSIDRKEIRPVKDFGVSVSVGAQLPTRVDLRPLPREIASMRPQYRDFRYTVSDSEIVIVDPSSRRIVEVIERDGRSGGGANLYAVFEQRRDVRRWRRPDTVVFQTGVILPREAQLYALPVEVIETHPQWRGYQYVMTETDEIAVVEPRSRRIVEVVDRSSSHSGTTTAAGPAPAATQASASLTDRHELAKLILQDSKPGEMQSLDGLKGAVLPSEVVIRPLPSEAEQREPQLRGMQYTLIGDDVLIVDPQSRRIVDVIE